MRVLMIAPHPVYSPRGTPISVYNRCLALGALGHEVDLVTYPSGTDRPAPGLRYLRPGRRLWTDREVPIGMSRAKVTGNLLVGWGASRRAIGHRRTYDVVHSHEEGALAGLPIARALGLPHVYDMGNGWSTVLANYDMSGSAAVVRGVDRLERAVLRRSDVSIVQLPVSFDRVRRDVPSALAVLLANIPLDQDTHEPGPVPPAARAVLRSPGPVVLYAGSLEPYQGVELLVDAMAAVADAVPAATLVVAGGRGAQVATLAERAAAGGVVGRCRLIGTVDPSGLPALLRAADVLVSPRVTGDNTPLKLFTYLRAGRPMVLTDIVSHTQVVGPDDAELVAPTVASLAAGIIAVLTSPARARDLARAAGRLSRRWSPAVFLRGTADAYLHVGGMPADDDRIGSALRSLAGRTAPRAPAAPATDGAAADDPDTDSPDTDSPDTDRPDANHPDTNHPDTGRLVTGRQKGQLV